MNYFKELKVWQKAIEIVTNTYLKSQSFPKEEIYGLTSQIRRCAVSIPSNIAEGFRRKHTKEYQQFLAIALGSLGELETQVEIAKRLQYAKQNESADYQQMIEELCKMTNGLLRKVRASHDS